MTSSDYISKSVSDFITAKLYLCKQQIFSYRKFNILESLKILEFPKTSGRENNVKSQQKETDYTKLCHILSAIYLSSLP